MKSKAINFLQRLDQFIAECSSGRKLQKSGARIGQGTIQNYRSLRLLLSIFTTEENFELRIRSVNKMTAREMRSERSYWKRFYRKFTGYLYDKRHMSDNTVATNLKLIRSFLNHLKRDGQIAVGDFHHNFYVRPEEIPIVVLQPEQLNRLIRDKAFEASLPEYLQRTKDVFVFGCTVGLRISDLFALRKSNLETSEGRWYLSVRSRKTGERSRVALPDYAMAILKKYRRTAKTLLPRLSISRLNGNIKELVERAGWTHEVPKVRLRRGRPVTLRNNGKSYRFCDLVSSHTMRRTAITTMLRYGMPELMVRRISGHRDGSKEFYRYVRFAQSYQDHETDKVFSRFNQSDPKSVEQSADGSRS